MRFDVKKRVFHLFLTLILACFGGHFSVNRNVRAGSSAGFWAQDDLYFPVSLLDADAQILAHIVLQGFMESFGQV